MSETYKVKCRLCDGYGTTDNGKTACKRCHGYGVVISPSPVADVGEWE